MDETVGAAEAAASNIAVMAKGGEGAADSPLHHLEMLPHPPHLGLRSRRLTQRLPSLSPPFHLMFITGEPEQMGRTITFRSICTSSFMRV
ncbi:unnamed protein product [Linum trigynum]|uniref:Uncharacterized protein n=1 Tax=Linum trigynum TaxID=586398 RepID=A0AAV2GPP9_9ROSI